MSCSVNKKCNKSITTDPGGVAIVKTRNEHCCGKKLDPRGIEARQLRVQVRHKSGDITKRPAIVIRTELRDMNKNNLQRMNIRNVSLSLYRELPTLQKT